LVRSLSSKNDSREMTHLLHRQIGQSYPLAASSQGVIRDTAGREYIDASSGAAVSCLGHSHPDVLGAMREQLDRAEPRRGKTETCHTDPTHLGSEASQLRSAARCGANTRSGRLCQAPAVAGRARCRMHGGAKGSGGPRGRRNGNYKHGRYTAEAKQRRLQLRAVDQGPIAPGQSSHEETA
jgi:hypothetical protein